MIINDVSDYINILVRITHIICNRMIGRLPLANGMEYGTQRNFLELCLNLSWGWL